MDEKRDEKRNESTDGGGAQSARRVQRINELARKKKEAGLTPAEAQEQHALRQEYLQAFRAHFRQTLESVRIQEEDGSLSPLKKKDPTP